MNLQEKLIAIADHYGLESQTIKLAEEGAELSAAMLKNLVLLFVRSKEKTARNFGSRKPKRRKR